MDTLDLLLHPVRLRIMHAMSGGRVLTTSDLCARLPDVPKTSVYRHVGLLAEAGVLEVAGEQRVHGAVERRYRLHRARAVIDEETAASMTLDDHRQAFAAAMATLLAEFNTYLGQEHADPFADSVGYIQVPLWLSEDELAGLIRRGPQRPHGQEGQRGDTRPQPLPGQPDPVPARAVSQPNCPRRAVFMILPLALRGRASADCAAGRPRRSWPILTVNVSGRAPQERT